MPAVEENEEILIFVQELNYNCLEAISFSVNESLLDNFGFNYFVINITH